MNLDKKLVIALNEEYIEFNKRGEIVEVQDGIEIKGIFVSNQTIEQIKSSPNKRFINIKEAISYSKNRIHNVYISEIQFFVEIYSVETGISTFEKLMEIKKDGAIISLLNNLGVVFLKINILLGEEDAIQFVDKLNSTELVPVDWFKKRSSSKDKDLQIEMENIIKNNSVRNITFKTNIKVDEKYPIIELLKEGFNKLENSHNYSSLNIPEISFEFYPTLKDAVRYQDNIIQARIEEFCIENFINGMMEHLQTCKK